MTRASACATAPSAQLAADRVLVDGGGAADAVVAGYFALAGELPGGLLSPVTILVAGPGVAGRAFDGRATQPGAGAKRPRGFVDESVPMAARAAVSRAPHAVLLLQANHGRRSLKKNAAQGVALAKSAGATKRASFLDRVSEGGSVALASANDAILRVAGVFSSGLITEEDLVEARPADAPARVIDHTSSTGESMRVHLEPWAGSENGAAPELAAAHAIAAVDSRGLLVVLTSFIAAGGSPNVAQLVVPEIEIALPLVAEPVRRGKTRVAPGAIFAVQPTLAAVDCGPDLRLAVSALGGLDIEKATTAFGARPIEDGLRSIAEASSLVGVISTARDARPVAFRTQA
ncbi:MAG: hypothetical protein HOW73_38870 [Polyangiaceae bacterium]|nr:hypothetical protein [Polyangiaceae bacterium]